MISLLENNDFKILKLNRPEKRNALHPTMVNQIREVLTKISDDNRTKALIITGEGSSFCAGADLEYLNTLQNCSSIENEKDSENLADMFLRIYKLPFPTIAAVNGPAVAGGCGLASVCDFVIADSEKAKFGYTEVKIGFVPAIVSIFLMRKIGVGNSKKLLLTGELIDSARAHLIGLADFITKDVLSESISLASKFTANSLTSYVMTKKMISDISTFNIDDAVNYCVQLNVISRSSEDFKERIKKILKK